MEEVDVPITAGAQYETIDGEVVRVESVWVDEDLTTSIRISHNDDSRTLTLEDFVARISPTDLERCNTDHEAWEYRQ